MPFVLKAHAVVVHPAPAARAAFGPLLPIPRFFQPASPAPGNQELVGTFEGSGMDLWVCAALGEGSTWSVPKQQTLL